MHGITSDFLADKPPFGDVADDFLAFIDGAELIIHNAPFDVAFIDYELGRLEQPRRRVEEACAVVDTLAMARHKHPGQKNSLDALCRRYDVDNSQRELHGALLDAEILADVYLMMTGGQTVLFVADEVETSSSGSDAYIVVRLPVDRPRLRVVDAAEQNFIGTAQCSTTSTDVRATAASGDRRHWRSPTDATTAPSWNRRTLC